MAQIVITEQDYTFTEDKQIRHHWTITLLRSGRLVGKLDEVAGGRVCLTTYGDHPSGNRYRTVADMDEATRVAIRWGTRRFRHTVDEREYH